MNQTVQQITQQLIVLLPEKKQFYRLDELRSNGFPSFIVRRIQIELERNIIRSTNLPSSDWANMQSENVDEAWQRFLQAAKAEAHLPADHIKAVVETAVSDVLSILIQPHKNIPNLLFGEKNELDYQEVCEAVKIMVVYRHFAQIIPRYMRRKGIEHLSRDRCALVIRNADEKLTGKYTPLNWAQMLEPLFKLQKGKVDSRSLRSFFEDRNKPQLTQKFTTGKNLYTRDEFIEKLSSPDSTSDETGGKRPVFFENLPHMKATPDEEQAESKPQGQREKQGKIEEKQESSSRSTDALNAGFSAPIKNEAETDDSLNAVFSFDQPEALPNDEELGPNEASKGSGDVESLAENAERDGLNENTPMWMRFFNEEEAEPGFSPEEATPDGNGILDQPAPDLREPAKDELLKWLSDNRDLFVEEIFGGSDHAFNEAVEEIITYKNWRNASKYIEKEVFKRNLINIYSEVAVNFTDRLQSYFLEKQNQN